MKNIKFCEYIPVGQTFEEYANRAQKCGLKLFETFTEPNYNVYVLEGTRIQFLRYFVKDVISGEFVDLKTGFGVLKEVIFYKGD